MCYQKSLNQSEDNLTRYLDKPPVENNILKPYFLNDGFTHDTIYIIPMDEPTHWYPAKWGLVPSFSTPEEFYKNRKYNTLNARGDKVFESRMYGKSIREKRCLIFADGFFEPHHFGKESQPYFCYLQESENFRDRSIFMFAGIYSTDAHQNYYASLITVEANSLFENIHNKAKRMPLALDRKYELEWIDDGLSENMVEEIMQEGFTTKNFTAHPVMNYRLKKNWEFKDTAKVLQPVKPIDKAL